MSPPGERGEDWFSALYATHHPHLVRYALRRGADLDMSVELAQEVFVVAWRKRFDVPDHGLPWLYAVARRILANRWRARHAAPTTVPLVAEGAPARRPATDPTVQHAADRLGDALAALAALSETDREILRLVGWEELTVAEAAVVLGCSRTTAAVRLHRARRRLTEAMRAVPTGADAAAIRR